MDFFWNTVESHIPVCGEYGDTEAVQVSVSAGVDRGDIMVLQVNGIKTQFASKASRNFSDRHFYNI